MTGAPLAAVRTAALLRPEFDSTIFSRGAISPLFDEYCRQRLGRAPVSGELSATDFDLVICHSAGSARAVKEVIERDRKVLWWIHEDTLFFDLTPSVLVNHCLSGASALVFTSPHCAWRTFANWTWKRKGIGVHIVPNWAEPVARAPPRPGKAGIDIVHVASLRPAKGSDIVLRAAHATQSRGWRFHLVGRQPEGTRLPDIPPNVVLHGEVAPREVRRIISESDVLLHPSRQDNQPLVILEALASGIPAIGSELPSIDCYADARHGYWSVPVDTPDTVGLVLRRIRDLAQAQARLPRAFTAAHHRQAALEAVYSTLESH